MNNGRGPVTNNRNQAKTINNGDEDKRLPLFNICLIAASFLIIVIGIILMYIGPDSESGFEPDIFSVRRTVIAPVIIFIGFISVAISILWQKRSKH